MADFSFLKQFIVPSESQSQVAPYDEYRHQLFPLKAEIIREADKAISIPSELKEFYLKIGYGFFFRQQKISFNRLLDPGSFRMINLKEDYYESDPQLEIYDRLYRGTKLLFFEVIEGRYLAIQAGSESGSNAIFYFEKKIANSLEEFLSAFDANPELLNN